MVILMRQYAYVTVPKKTGIIRKKYTYLYNDGTHIPFYLIFKFYVNVIRFVYVTGPEKTGLIYAKYTHSYYGAYLFVCSSNLISVSFI